MANELRYNLDTSIINYASKRCKQNDDRQLILTLFSGAVPFLVTGATLSLKAMRMDDTFVIQDTGLSIVSNVVTISMIRDITRIPGLVKLELKITLASKDISTFTFMLEVEPSVIQDGDVKSKNVMTALERLDGSLLSADAKNTTLKTTIGTATTTNANLNNTIGTANTAKDDLNASKANANETNITLKATITTANATKTALTTVNANANNTLTTLNTAIANGDTAAMKAKLDGIQSLLNAKVNKWNEIEYSSLQSVPVSTEVEVRYGLTKNGTVLGSLTTPTQFKFTEAGNYLIIANHQQLVDNGKSARITLGFNGSWDVRTIGTNVFSEDEAHLNVVMFKQVNVGDYMTLRVIHNNATACYVGHSKVKMIKLI